jgi:hypothetical protein
MSRRRGQPPDSLELLLDTLCNTFGGVLFIALLVVLLLQITGKRPEPAPTPRDTPDDPAALAARLESARDEIARLGAMMTRYGAAIDPADAALAARLVEEERRLRARQQAAARRREELLPAIAASRAAVREIAAGLADLDRRRDEARAELERARAALGRERRERARAIGTPLLHDTDRRTISCELRYGRFYVMHRVGPDGIRAGPNLDDYFVLEETAAGLEMRPRPAGGLALDDEADLPRRLRQHLVDRPPDRYYLDLIVRTDSFDAFHRLRRAAAQSGYEISILLAEPGQQVRDQGGRFRGVQ